MGNVVMPDISHWETVTSWKKLKEEVPFIIFKGTQRCDYIDPKAYETIVKCEEYKIPYWIYAFVEKGGELEQAKFLVKTFKPYVNDSKYFCGWCIDAEDKKVNNDEEVLKALKYLEGSGKWKVILYTMYAQRNKLLNSIQYATRKDKITWWEARYGIDNGKYNALFQPHKGVDFHQYTSKGSLPYIKGDVDLNRLTGTLDRSWFTETLYMRRNGQS